MTAGRSKQEGSKPASISVKRASAAKAGEPPTIVLVDDDPSVLRALSRLMRGAGFRVVAFDRPSALLASAIPKANACLVVDINERRRAVRHSCGVRAGPTRHTDHGPKRSRNATSYPKGTSGRGTFQTLR